MCLCMSVHYSSICAAAVQVWSQSSKSGRFQISHSLIAAHLTGMCTPSFLICCAAQVRSQSSKSGRFQWTTPIRPGQEVRAVSCVLCSYLTWCPVLVLQCCAMCCVHCVLSCVSTCLRCAVSVVLACSCANKMQLRLLSSCVHNRRRS